MLEEDERAKHTVWVVVALSEKSSLLRSDVVKVNEHPLHGHISAVKLPSKDKRAVAASPKLLLRVYLDIAHPHNGLANGLHVVWLYGDDVGFDTSVALVTTQLHGCIDRIIVRLGGGGVSLRLREFTSLTLAVLDPAPSASMCLLLLLR